MTPPEGEGEAKPSYGHYMWGGDKRYRYVTDLQFALKRIKDFSRLMKKVL